ncbi:hypothetical protein BJX70DRAFT_397595 [Aspergillus crustosus]
MSRPQGFVEIIPRTLPLRHHTPLSTERRLPELENQVQRVDLPCAPQPATVLPSAKPKPINTTCTNQPRRRLSLLSSSIEAYHAQQEAEQTNSINDVPIISYRKKKTSNKTRTQRAEETSSKSSPPAQAQQETQHKHIHKQQTQRKEEPLNSSNLAEIASNLRLDPTKPVERPFRHTPLKKPSAMPFTPRRLRNEQPHWSARAMSKRVTFARDTLLVPEGPRTPSPQSSPPSLSPIALPTTSHAPSRPGCPGTSCATSEPVNSTKGEALEPQTLTVSLLSTMKAFRAYAGCLYNNEPNSKPAILFEVEFLDGSTGLIQAIGEIPGEPKNVHEAFGFHLKVRNGKDLVSDEDWRYLERWFGVLKGETMEFEWLRLMRGRGFEARRARAPAGAATRGCGVAHDVVGEGDGLAQPGCNDDHNNNNKNKSKKKTVLGMLKGATFKVGACLMKLRALFGSSG